MGGKSSRGVAPNGLNEPLLPLYHKVNLGSQGSAAGSGLNGSVQSAPASFKAGKPRKTKDFIGDEIILRSSSRPVWEAPADIDPRLLDEEKTMQAISEQVASLLSRYVEEGKSKQQDKDDDEFHEEHFLRRRFCSCCPFRSRVPNPQRSKETILDFLNKIAESLYFCKQVVVLCAIYIERLLQRTDTVLTSGNWRSLVTAGMLISSKVWEDIHPWNADFEECLVEIAGIRYRNGALYRLESLFLEKLQWQVFVDGEIYAAWFFSLQEGRQCETKPSASRRPRKAQRLQRHHSDVSNFAIMPIIEDEPLVESETDIEKALASPQNPLDFSGHSTMSTDSSVSQTSQMDMDFPERAGESLHNIRSCWRLDAGNPHIGSLRHAPRALAPSKHIQQSEELLWAHKLAAKTTELFGHRKSNYSEAHTLSGATGNQLQTELLQYLKKRGEEKNTKNDGARADEITLNMLEEKSLWPADVA